MLIVGQAIPYPLMSCYIGCMESLFFYKQLMLRRHEASMTTQQREDLTRECTQLLTRLQEIDPDRQQRYADLGGPSTRFLGQERILMITDIAARTNA